MSLDKSIVEDAALAMPVAALAPTLSDKETEKREAIRRPAGAGPAIREEERAMIRQFRRVRIERRTDP
jgi:hypothetical protein